jgi:hypothetical protein
VAVVVVRVITIRQALLGVLVVVLLFLLRQQEVGIPQAPHHHKEIMGLWVLTARVGQVPVEAVVLAAVVVLGLEQLP